MAETSLIVTAWRELYLQETIDNLIENLTGDYEIIVVLDGYWPKPIIRDHPRLILLHRERRGMRAALNAAASIAQGETLIKLDAHCAIAKGLNQVLYEDCPDNAIMVPRRYSLFLDDWEPKRSRRIVDYEFLCHPSANKGRMHGKPWKERAMERCNKLIDENMTFQGSCWAMKRNHFWDRLGGYSEEGYGTFICEAQEIGLKTWLGGGRTLVNKKTWYAHLWKGEQYRNKFNETFGDKYTRVGHSEYVDGNKFNTDYWMNNRWEGRQHDLSWLIERFWPIPSWPEDRNEWTWKS